MSRTRHHGDRNKQKYYGKDWDTYHHTRPRRRKDKQKCHKVKQQQDLGADELFELDHKPHKYYW